MEAFWKGQSGWPAAVFIFSINLGRSIEVHISSLAQPEKNLEHTADNFFPSQINASNFIRKNKRHFYRGKIIYVVNATF